MPKKVIRYLWLIVRLRLILPFSIETGFSLIPSSKTIMVPNDSIPVINTGFEMIDNNVNLLVENNITNQIEIATTFHSFVDIACIVCKAIIDYVKADERVGDKVALYGISYGGYLAIRCACFLNDDICGLIVRGGCSQTDQLTKHPWMGINNFYLQGEIFN